MSLHISLEQAVLQTWKKFNEEFCDFLVANVHFTPNGKLLRPGGKSQKINRYMSSCQVEAKVLSRYDVSINLFNQKPNSFRSERDSDIFEIGLRESFDRITQEEIGWMATPRLIFLDARSLKSRCD